MNPNKKTLNPQNNSPWLLCPSKSFPGKFYYFNGSTGETAWSINEADSKNCKKSTIHKVTDKTHTYPEPFGPPADESTNITNSSSFLKNNNLGNTTNFSSGSNNMRPCISSSMLCNKSNFCNGGNCSNGNSFNSGNSNEPKFTFGSNLHHGVNLRCGTNSCHQTNSCDNFNYGPNMKQRSRPSTHLNHKGMGTQFHSIPSESPMFGQAVFPRYVTNDVTTKVIWALTPMFVPEKVIPTQTQYDLQNDFQSLPLLQFENYQVNTQKYPFCSKKFQTSTPIIKHSEAETQTIDQKFTKDDACQTFIPRRRLRTQSETDSVTPNFTLKLSKSVENLDTSDTRNKTSFAPSEDNDNAKLTALDKNDLRFKLVAKRRMSVDVDALESNKDNARLPIQPLNEIIAPKKRVTFDLHQNSQGSADVQEDEIQSPGSVHSDSLESSKLNLDCIWYITVDTQVLLTELECIEQFVQSDKNCRLLIPYTVKSELESLSRGECNGRQNIFTARQIVRKLATPAPHIVVQRRPENNTDEGGILECSWQLLQENCQVILITNNKNLSSKAEKVGLEYHTTDEIKDILKPTTPPPEIDLTNVKITVNNSEKRSENLFQQSISELNSLHLPQREFPVHFMRKSLFDNGKCEKHNVFSNQDNSDKLINLTNTSKALKNVSYADVDEIDLDIQRLDISDNNANDNEPNNSELINEIQNRAEVIQLNDRNNKDTIKVSGITKLDSVFDIDDELQRYEVKGGEMENRIKSRRDEWVCRLTQTMERVLTDILLQENFRPKKLLPPWSLHEVIQILGDKFKSLPKIKIITTRFTMHLFNCSSNVGKLNKDIHPKEFIKLVGFSMILIQSLKETLDYIELNEADDLLSELIKHIEDPNTDVDLSLDKVITPTLTRNDIELETKIPFGYKKKQSDVLEYLKIHFPSMESYEIEMPEPKVVRTVGKDLSTLKINNTKTITVDTVNNLPLEEVKNTAVSEPKVIRNVKVIDAFEEKLMKQTVIDLDDLDYEVTLSTISFENEEINDKNDEVEIDESKVDRMDDSVSNSDCAKEESLCSDFNECIHAYPLMKAFLARLKRTFILIYNFISYISLTPVDMLQVAVALGAMKGICLRLLNASYKENERMEDYQRGMSDDKRSDVTLKINMAHKYILKLVERLKCIIARECSEGTTLKDLLIQAGDYVDEDQTMAGYRLVVVKYLEQAQILEEALTLMLTIMDETERQPTANGIAYHGTFTAVAGQSAASNSNKASPLANQVL